MVCAGVDVGARNLKLVVLKDGQVVARAVVPAGYEIDRALKAAWAASGWRREQVDVVVATGVGRRQVEDAQVFVSEVAAAAMGGWAVGGEGVVVEVGAEEARAVRVGEGGGVEDFVVSERCAAGVGMFVEAMARALELDWEEMDALSLRAPAPAQLNSRCVVFAESEVVALIHSNVPRAEIARAIHEAVAARSLELIRRLGVVGEVVIVGGGVAASRGFVRALASRSGSEVVVAWDGLYMGAVGAALVGAGRAGG